MKCRSILLLGMVVCLGFISCGKSDQEKAEEFVKTIDKNAKVLFILPDSASKCIFYAEDNLIKCHNVETDSTTTIPYGEIDESTVSKLLAGKNHIMVITQDYDMIDGAYVYDLAKGKFSTIEACPNNMIITDTKLSESNKNITFTCNTTAKAPRFALLMSRFDSSSNFASETGYYEVEETYDFDGELIKTKKTPISNREWCDREGNEDQRPCTDYDNSSSSSSSSPAVYRWECLKCGEVRESVETPDPHGCPYSGHSWSRQERVR